MSHHPEAPPPPILHERSQGTPTSPSVNGMLLSWQVEEAKASHPRMSLKTILAIAIYAAPPKKKTISKAEG